MKQFKKQLNTSHQRNIVEDKIVEWIAKEAGGQITVFKPKSVIKGVDLIVKKRGVYPEKGLHLQVKGRRSLDDNRMFIKDIQEKDFTPEGNLYLIFAYFDIVEQKLDDDIWLVPSLEIRDLAEHVTIEGGPQVLRFEAPVGFQKRNKYTKFLINKKDLAKVLLRIVVDPGKFEFPKTGIGKIRTVNLKELKKFIVEARKNTYAGVGNPVDNPRLIGSVQLEYQKGDFFYRDIYFTGAENFIGQEVIYQNNKSVWSMVYFGSAEPKEVSDFLKTSLLTLAEECRFGKKCEFEKRNFHYKDEGNGTLKRFNGEEEISIKGKEVYKLNYHGGLVLK